ncbi:hypothetical protein PT974_09268 [Cladobotryum mycophilum]|uniref:Uncharacterized protein n=1 Tax=Cladobotryum mycophilum TaxID=491253 RepID=A0ABR0SFS3_9HYPO
MQLHNELGHRPKSPTYSCASSSKLRPEPVPASLLANLEARRRDLVRELGPCRSGCKELDDYILLGGGFERGCVVGISAEDEDGFGMVLGLQVLVCSLLDGVERSVLIITPKPSNAVLGPLRNGITTALAAKGLTPEEVARKRKQYLDQVMLSCVFDMDGLCEVLADLDMPESEKNESMMPKPDDPAAGKLKEHGRRNNASLIGNSPQKKSLPLFEIQDSQDEEEEESIPLPSSPKGHLSAGRQEPAPKISNNDDASANHFTNPNTNNDTNGSNNLKLPEVIIITHFSSILTSLYTQREKSAAHITLQLLSSRLRHLSRTLSSHPLILLLNSTDSSNTSTETYQKSNLVNLPQPPSSNADTVQQPTTSKAVDPTLRSIFNPPLPARYIRPSPADEAFRRRIHKTNKPSFGMIFTQLLDLHLLCTRVPRTTPVIEKASPSTQFLCYVTVVEVLLDEMGLWEGKRGNRRRREQRWAPFDVRRGCVTDAFDLRVRKMS